MSPRTRIVGQTGTLALLLAICGVLTEASLAGRFSQGSQGSRTQLVFVGAGSQAVAKFGRFEVAFTIDGTRATFFNWPYDAAPPKGVPAGAGITVNGVFVDPGGREHVQPAFYHQRFEDAVREGRDWHYPTSDFSWKVRFSPNQTGTWKYRIVLQDRDGTRESEWRTFSVSPSSSHGFIRVSKADSRYFEFEDGTLFTGLGFQVPEHLDDPTTGGAPLFRQLGGSGVNFVRLWVGSVYGSAWTPWVGGRNQYTGYLPVTGLAPFTDKATGDTMLTTRLDYEAGGDTGWFDACRLQWGNSFQAVKPNTRYRVRATYHGRGISGPRAPRSPGFGFVVKAGGMFPNCYEPGTSRPVTGYGSNSPGWQQVEGIWNSGSRNFLPKLHLALENVQRGEVFVRSVSVREILSNGGQGPEILVRPSMEYELYVPQAKAHALDRIVELAEQNGVYLKLVVMEKDDKIYKKMGDSGEFVTGPDNRDGVYGIGRTVNKTRWLQQAWWRYLQARWGYSPNVHSWELLNEGDPASTAHYELADEFGKFMHYGVFGARPAPSFDHPNDHLVTTSFWHSFPSDTFWASARYPHVDYADVHAYVSTSFAPRAEREKMQWDAAYYHTWHSQHLAARRVGKPIVRGEAGLDVPDRQDERALGLQRERNGVWLHNFLWSGLDAGGLYELYWWSSHIWGGQVDHRGAYRTVNAFLSSLPLNKGGYVDWGGSVSDSDLRVVGQKNPVAGRMHLWIQNSRYTWRNMSRGQAIKAASGEIQVPGFLPGAVYEVEWWDTSAADKAISALQDTTADASGRVNLVVDALQKDTALQLRLKSSRAPAAQSSSTQARD